MIRDIGYTHFQVINEKGEKLAANVRSYYDPLIKSTTIVVTLPSIFSEVTFGEYLKEVENAPSLDNAIRRWFT